MKEYIFTWSIENISYSWHKINEKIVSPIFTADTINSTSWTLRLYPRGFRNSDYLSLLLRRETDNFPGSLRVNFELSCVSADTSLVQPCIFPENLYDFTKTKENGFGEYRFLKRYEVFGQRKSLYLPQDILTLRCRMWKDENGDGFGESYRSTLLKLEEVGLSENLKELSIIEVYFKHGQAGARSKDPQAIIGSKNPQTNIGSNDLLILINIASHRNKFDIKINPDRKVVMKSATLNFYFQDTRTKRKLCEHQIIWTDGPLEEVFSLPFSDTDYENSEIHSVAFHYKFIYSTGEYEVKPKDFTLNLTPEFISIYHRNLKNSRNGRNLYEDIRKNDQNLCEDIKNLYEKKILCDIKLECKDATLLAHKTVLCARSSVISTMLTNDMKERHTGCIKIGDISVNTMESFLNFLYTDEFTDHSLDAVIDLYYAADKYAVDPLKISCSSYLKGNIDLVNVCTLVKFADLHNDCELMREVKDFILKNKETVFGSSSWKLLVDEQSHLAEECMLWEYEENENQPPTDVTNKSTSPKLMDDIRTLYRNRDVTDIIIKSQRLSYHAHKIILASGSTTFKNILWQDSSITSIDFIEINDLDDETISAMLFFLYEDSLENIQWNLVLKLYHASVLYQIDRLQIKCSRIMLRGLRVSNACEILLSAHNGKDNLLKPAVQNYIWTYDEQVFKSDEWHMLTKNNIHLANETMLVKYKR